MPVPLTGQVALSGTAQAVASPVQATAFTIKASATNGSNAFLGPASVSASTGYVLSPGESLSYEDSGRVGLPAYQLRLSDFYVVGSAGDVVSWLASP